MPRKPLVIGLVWVASLTAAVLVGRAQTRIDPVPPFVVLSSDMAFRVEGRIAGTPVGHLVIRKDANSPWTPVELSGLTNARRID